MKNKVIPFQGIRYNLNKFKSAGEFVCWPYDIIDKNQQEDFYKKSPYNVIRIALGKEKKTDNEKNNKYTRAAESFQQWQKKRVLQQEETPALYLYQQVYKVPFTNETKTIVGFIGLVKLQDYSERKVIPHEDVLSKPLADRFSVFKAMNAQESPIYGVYEDSRYILDNTLKDYMKKYKPDINYNENHSINHKVWILNNPETIKKIQKNINAKTIYIADGHHRYHTMLNYKKYYREQNKIPENQEHPVDYIMMFLVNSSHQGLTILPYHRILYNLQSIKLKLLLQHIKEYFHLKVFTYETPKQEELEKKRWLYLLNSTPANTHSFGIYIKKLKHFFLLTLRKKEAYLKLFDVQRSTTWKSLDVSIIHALLIDHILHITHKDVSNQIYIDYTKDYNEAIEKVKNENYQVAIICNATKINQILKIAQLGEKMPQKSTYFYPKILTGIVLYDMNKKNN